MTFVQYYIAGLLTIWFLVDMFDFRPKHMDYDGEEEWEKVLEDIVTEIHQTRMDILNNLRQRPEGENDGIRSADGDDRSEVLPIEAADGQSKPEGA